MTKGQRGVNFEPHDRFAVIDEQRFVGFGEIGGKAGATGDVSDFGVGRGKSEAKPGEIGGLGDFVGFDGRWV